MMNIFLHIVIYLFVFLKSVYCLAGVVLDTNGEYNGISVAILNDVPQERCEEIVNQIVAALQETSSQLHTATNQRLSFGPSINIVVPNSWTDCQIYSISDGEQTASSATFRVGTTHHLFGDHVWTEQPRQCGEEGDFTYIPEKWLSQTTITNQGRSLTREWAKLRWGVFDEHGFLGDRIYPPAFRDSSGTMVPNVCSDSPTIANISNCEEESTCVVAINQNDNFMQTSSLMSFENLPNVNHFCTSETHTHTNTKHYMLCDGASVQTVLDRHLDFANQVSHVSISNISAFVYKSPVIQQEFITIAFENGQPMTASGNILEYLLSSIEQLLNYELEDFTSIALVKFGMTGVKIVDRALLRDKREEMVQAVADIKVDQTSQSKNLINALKISAATFASGLRGTILLITQNIASNYVLEDLNAIFEAAGGHRVNIILYPSSQNNLEYYQTIAERTGGTMTNIMDSAQTGDQNLLNRQILSDEMRLITEGTYFDKIGDASCIGADDCPLTDFPLPNNYKTEAYVYIYTDSFRSLNAHVSSGADECPELGADNEKITTIFRCNPSVDAVISVTIEKSPNDFVYYEVAARPDDPVPSDRIENWWSQDPLALEINDLQVPIFYARVIKNNSVVVGASVKINLTSLNQPYSLELYDTGTGADVTGRDGIYSVYLMGLPALFQGQIGYSIQANDNNGTAVFLPTLQEPIECCGSRLQLGTGLTSAGSFQLSVSSDAINVPTPVPTLSFPPSSITDLESTSDGSTVTLTFTAPGAQKDFGTVTSYSISYRSESTNETRVLEQVGVEPSPPGSLETISFASEICDMVTCTVSSVNADQTPSKVSNEVRTIVSCSANDNLNAAEISGIVIGVLIIILLLIYLNLLFITRKDKENSLVWQITLCKCCMKDQNNSKSSKANTQPPQRTVTMIKSINDLYKTEDMQQKTGVDNDNDGFYSSSDDDDGGFQNTQYTGGHMQNNYPVTREYQSSIRSSGTDLSNIQMNNNGVPSHVRGSFDFYPTYHATPISNNPNQFRNPYNSYMSNNQHRPAPPIPPKQFNTQV